MGTKHRISHCLVEVYCVRLRSVGSGLAGGDGDGDGEEGGRRRGGGGGGDGCVEGGRGFFLRQQQLLLMEGRGTVDDGAMVDVPSNAPSTTAVPEKCGAGFCTRTLGVYSYAMSK